MVRNRGRDNQSRAPASAAGLSGDNPAEFEHRLDVLKWRHSMLQLMDYLILEGAKMQRGYFVFLLQAARAELDKK